MVTYLILVAGLVVLVAVLIVTNRKDDAASLTAKLRATWGHPKKDVFYFERIERYADLMMKEKGFHRLSRQTIEDIDLYDLFSFLDRTTSSIGQQYLFHRLINPQGDIDSLRRLGAMADHFRSDASIRERIQRELTRLGTSGAYFVCSLLSEKVVHRPSWMSLLPISSALTLLMLVFGLYYPVLFVALIVPLTFNSFLHYWNRERIFAFSRSFQYLNVLIDVIEKISGMDERFSDSKSREAAGQLKSFQWKLRLLGSTGNIGEMSQFSEYFFDLIKGMLLIEVYMSYNMIRDLERKRSAIRELFNHVGWIDTAISVASLRSGSLPICVPDFISADKALTAKSLYHPLVKRCVGNDLIVNGKSILITGSNMSGKSTFLRTLILNSILAQTLHTCFGDEFKTPVLKQFSSIRLDDSVEKGTSYFFEEVNLMRSLIGEAESNMQGIFVLDEVFKGTNTLERVAAAKAILSYLNRGHNIVVVSTHDLELSSLLKKEYDLYHFEETFADDTLVFDHKLKPGPLKNSNAIRILSVSGYPSDIIDEATTLVNTFKQ